MTRRLVIAALGAALAFSAAWLWRAAGDGEVTYQPVAPGAAGVADGVAWQLQTLRVVPGATDAYGGQVTAVTGAVLVRAEVAYDASGRPGELACSFELVAGALRWPREWTYTPPAPAATSCTAGTKGTAVALFEVPARAVSEVTGVAVRSGSPQVLLLGGSPG